ncbi:MAG: hypothetical protein ACOYVK_00610 [Bacillota bacterium]
MILTLYIIAAILGLFSQKIKINLLAFSISFISATLVLLASNDIFLTYIIGKISFISLIKEQLIILICIFFTANSLGLYSFKILRISRLEKRLKYSDYIANREIQITLDRINEDLKKYRHLLGDKFFLSVYFVYGRFFKKIVRVGYSGEIPKNASDWDGVIKKIKNTSTGRCLKSKKVEIIDFKNLDENSRFDGLPPTLEKWSREFLAFRIIVPMVETYMLFRWELNATKIIYAINSLDQKNHFVDWKNLTNEQETQLKKILHILKLEKSKISNLYEYFNI